MKTRWSAIWQESEMMEAWKRVEKRKKQEETSKATLKAEAERERQARQGRYVGVLDKFVNEGHKALFSFAKTGRVNFNEKEATSIYYGIMAFAAKHEIGLDAQAGI